MGEPRGVDIGRAQHVGSICSNMQVQSQLSTIIPVPEGKSPWSRYYVSECICPMFNTYDVLVKTGAPGPSSL